MRCLSRGWRPPKSGERYPSAHNIYQDSKILYPRVAEKNAEDVEHVMAIVGKRKRMNDGVVTDYHQHGCNRSTDHSPTRVDMKGGWPYNCEDNVTTEKRPGEEGKVRPDVDHLRKVK